MKSRIVGFEGQVRRVDVIQNILKKYVFILEKKVKQQLVQLKEGVDFLQFKFLDWVVLLKEKFVCKFMVCLLVFYFCGMVDIGW